MCQVVVYDACVLYPMILRDLLLRFAATDLFMARWTNMIHDEWIRSLLISRPDISIEKLNRLRTLIDQSTPDCIIEGYENLIPNLKLPDPDDIHVLAAAIHTNASIIVTFNLKDFPQEIIECYRIEACHPDDFIMRMADINLDAILNATKIAKSSLKRPPLNCAEYFGILEKHGMIRTVALFKQFEHML